MLVLIGARTFVKTPWQGVYACRRCLGRHPHDLQERTEWGTLFFVPIVPLRRERLLTCHNCGLITRLSKAEAEQFIPRPAR